MVRGFLSRLYEKRQRHILYSKILRRNDELVRFTLTKNKRSSYTLSAHLTLKRNLSKSVDLESLPFAESDAKEYFEKSLVFVCDNSGIVELNLTGDFKSNQSEISSSEHLFIFNFEPNDDNLHDTKIKSWKLQD